MFDLKVLFVSNKAGEKSATLTAFCYGFMVVNTKLILSGLTIMGFTLAPFSGTEYGIACGALGGVYLLNKNNNLKAQTAKDKAPESKGE